jgi:hypothetical protein
MARYEKLKITTARKLLCDIFQNSVVYRRVRPSDYTIPFHLMLAYKTCISFHLFIFFK